VTGSDTDCGPSLEIRPSLGRNIVYSVTAVAVAAVVIDMGWSGETSALPAFLAGFVLLAGAGVVLAAHLPGASGLYLTSEGFEVHELYNVKACRWEDVGPFTLKRRLVGKAVEFSHAAGENGRPEIRTLPGNYAISPYRLLQVMNEWRDRAIEPVE
jgi:hypothetical protein